MNSSLKWWHAQLNLGWRSFCHYWVKLWPWRRRYGLAQFRANYVPEGLPSYAAPLRDIAYKASHCTTCGMCDAVCPILNGEFIGPMRLVVSGMRGGPSLAAVASDLAIVSGENCTSCRACEKACPEEIPIVALAQGFQQQLEEVRFSAQ